MIVYLLRWIATLAIAFVAGKLMTKIKMPSILGWLIFMSSMKMCKFTNDTSYA